MAKCGIEKYDKLPSRIGVIDVDALRSGVKFLSWLNSLISKRMIYLMDRLEEAYKKNKNFSKRGKLRRKRYPNKDEDLN